MCQDTKTQFPCRYIEPTERHLLRPEYTLFASFIFVHPVNIPYFSFSGSEIVRTIPNS